MASHDPQYLSPAISRPLLIGWCAWLLFSWVVNLSLDTPGRSWTVDFDGGLVWRIPADAFVAVVRGMFQSILVGLVLAWPLWRLSTRGTGGIGREAAVDAAALWLVSQVVVWPMRVLVEWEVQRLLLIDGVLAFAAAAAALCVWFGRTGGGARRSAAMLLCAGVIFGPWLAAFVTGWPGAAKYSPLHMLWTLCNEKPGVDRAIGPRLAVAAAVVATAWVVGLARSGETVTPPRENALPPI